MENYETIDQEKHEEWAKDNQLPENQLARLVLEHLELDKQIKALEAKDELIREDVKTRMRLMGLSVFSDSQGNKVTYTEQSRDNLDKDKIREIIGAERYAECVTTKTFPVLKIMSKESIDAMKASYKNRTVIS